MSMFGNSGGSSPSIADIAAVTGGGNNGNGGVFGNGMEAIWAIILLIAIIGGGWGNGWNGNRGSGSGSGETIVVTPPSYGSGYGGPSMSFTDAAIQRGFDTSATTTKLDGLANGICSLGYDQLAQMNGINSNISQTGNNIINAITASSTARMQDTFALSREVDGVGDRVKDCCCNLETVLSNMQHANDMANCALRTQVHETGDAILINQNQNFTALTQAVKDGFADLQKANDQRYISELERKLSDCTMANMLSAQTNAILAKTNPEAQPAYIVQNPNCCATIPVTVQGNGCGCGSTCNNGLRVVTA